MKNYSELSDFEINKLVAIYLGVKPRKTISFTCQENDIYPEYCNNPSDAWPIIVENGITLAFDGSDWWADSYACWVDGCEWQIEGEISRNPLRAAMIVYLMMKGSE